MTNNTWLITKCDHHGDYVTSYEGHLVTQNEHETVLRCRWDHDTWMLGPFDVLHGDTFIENYPHDRWFNIMEIHAPDGKLRGWYCNLTRPAVIQENTLIWTDLALDVIILPDKSFVLDDTDEYRALPLDPRERRNVVKELRALLSHLKDLTPCTMAVVY